MNIYKNSNNNEYNLEEAIDRVGGKDVGKILNELSIKFLIDQGLKPTHFLLDLGCGCFRCSVPIIAYLNKGNYFALDGNDNLIKTGLNYLVPENLRDRVNFAVSWDFEFDLHDKFDFIWCQSVICHMPEKEVIKTFSFIKNHLVGKAYISYLEGNRNDEDPYYWSQSNLTGFADVVGLKTVFLGNWNHPRKLQMLLLNI